MTEINITLGGMTITIRTDSNEMPIITSATVEPNITPLPIPTTTNEKAKKLKASQLDLVRVEPTPLEILNPSGEGGYIPNDFASIKVSQKDLHVKGVHIAHNPKPETRVLLADVANHITVTYPISIAELASHFERKYKDKSIHRALAYLIYLQIIEIYDRRFIKLKPKLA